MPYVTEELWQRLPRDGKQQGASTIMLTSYPQSQPDWMDEAVEDQMEYVQKIISRLRHARTSAPPVPDK